MSPVPLPTESVDTQTTRIQHPNSAGPPPPDFLHTEVALQIPAVTAAPALALQLGVGGHRSTLSHARWHPEPKPRRSQNRPPIWFFFFVGQPRTSQLSFPFPSSTGLESLRVSEISHKRVRRPAASGPLEIRPCHAVPRSHKQATTSDRRLHLAE